jgi:[protein-PII] uridylyltransferase
LFRRFLEKLYLNGSDPLAPAISWTPYAKQGHSTVSICTWDGQQLLAKIAGSFAVVPLNILSADIYTRGDNVVLDIFRVCDLKSRAVTNEKDMARVESTLQRALTDHAFDFRPLLEGARRYVPKNAGPKFELPTRIIADNKSHPSYTLVQITTPDRVGLLYDLLSALGAEGISIALSRISTEKGVATDTFYVVDAISRGKITNADRIQALQQKLQQAALGTR